jgi:hypothetical protein
LTYLIYFIYLFTFGSFNDNFKCSDNTALNNAFSDCGLMQDTMPEPSGGTEESNAQLQTIYSAPPKYKDGLLPT